MQPCLHLLHGKSLPPPLEETFDFTCSNGAVYLDIAKVINVSPVAYVGEVIPAKMTYEDYQGWERACSRCSQERLIYSANTHHR
ncbi:DUF2790 domain-containing protein [Pseudomonas sp. FSL R10-2172]|nr:DUF2790 domain-containing protein [Pseudomonas sp. FSL R10-0765]MQT53371.1 DUF2790 domain-containing protein [Pseudomonas sp. FSL R10-2398]MQU01379.1 DUF2790 domain-containing protein [Pseudomonas sp. FSL R10-2245]MQU11235.1 DUF2790 domain-containing protein [Pseudomonas sp. FSL R10-2189]MQU40533.1 DUF2790 domain-containing protein [Pseudomonas sp. FSL R10-2172]